MSYIPAKSRLIPLLRRKRTARLWLGLALCWLVGCLLGLGWIVWATSSGTVSRWVMPTLAITVVLAAMAVWMRLRRSKPDWRACAWEIEAHYPELDGRLLTAIEQEPDAQGQFSYLQRRLSDEVLAHAKLVRWEKLFPRSRIGLIKLAHALAFAVFLMTCLKLGSMPQRNPGAAAISAGVVVTPGDTSIERGDSLVVMVRFNVQPPSEVNLVIHQSAAPVQRIPLLKSLDDPIFGGSVAALTEDLDYAVEYDGHTSRDYEVIVFEHPRLDRADAALTYPDYTQLPPKIIESTRRITAVEGTRLDLTLQLNKPVVSAQLVPRDRDLPPLILQPLQERPLLQLTGLVLNASERYSLQLVDKDGRTNKQSSQFVFNVLTNRPPELKITSPRGDTRPSALEEVTYAGTVFDDFGVVSYGFAYLIGGQEIHTVETGGQVPGNEKQAFQHLLPFEQLGVAPGDLVSWFFWAEDIGPDGQLRRTLGDLYFSEVRPFEEIFRQGQSQFGGMSQAQQPPPGEGAGGAQTARLAELQQQVIHATWKLQREHMRSSSRSEGDPQSSINGRHANDIAGRTGPGRVRSLGSDDDLLNGFLRRMIDSSSSAFGNRVQLHGQVVESASDRDNTDPIAAGLEPANPVDPFARDIQVVIDAQREAIAQAQEALQGQQDPRQVAMWNEAIQQMESALEQLGEATQSPAALEAALAAQQAAYQRLLRLQEREFSVSQNQNANSSGTQSGRQQQIQRQLDQLNLTSEENRYETERLAQAPQSAAQREQLQVMSRLSELARRQQDINERLQELQTALQEAPTAEAREQVRRELKRLQEEQRQMVSDLDELRQRMDSEENQSQFAEQRQQLEQTRDSAQRASEAAQEGSVSQALAAGTRAQQEMQEMRDELRNQSASAFAEDMRQMRSDARELSRQQAEIQEQIASLEERTRKSLGDSDETSRVRKRLAQQRERLTNLVDQATDISRLAEDAEPLMSGALYETLREFSQDDLGAVKELQEDLLANRNFPLYQHLKEVAEQSEAKTLDVTSEVVDQGFLELAEQTGERALQDIDDLARGIERAAELVLGDDTEALRRAERELRDLTDQLEDEIAQANDVATNAEDGDAASNEGRPGSNGSQPGQESSQGSPGEQNRDSQDSNSGGNGQLAGGENRNPRDAQPGSPQPGDPGSPGSGSEPNFDLDQFLGGGSGGANSRSGPIMGGDFGPWSDRLREVEELVELPDLRNDLIRARERARQLRRNYTRDQQKPDWAQVKLEIVEPLAEVRTEIGEELARRQSRESLVPIDRDPVPDRYSELVRRYYEQLGKDDQ